MQRRSFMQGLAGFFVATPVPAPPLLAAPDAGALADFIVLDEEVQVRGNAMGYVVRWIVLFPGRSPALVVHCLIDDWRNLDQRDQARREMRVMVNSHRRNFLA